MDWISGVEAWQALTAALLSTWTLLLALRTGGARLVNFFSNLIKGTAALRELGKNSQVMAQLAVSAGMHDQIMEILDRLKVVEHEMSFNSGKSSKDVLYEIRDLLYQTDEQSRIILSEAETGVFKADEAGEFVWVNRMFLERAYLLPSQVLGNGWVQLIHPDDREEVFKDWQDALRLRREFRRRFRLMTPRGYVYRVSVWAYILRGAEKRFSGYLGFVRYEDEPE